MCTLHHGRRSTTSAQTSQSPLGSIAGYSRFSNSSLPTFKLGMDSTAVELSIAERVKEGFRGTFSLFASAFPWCFVVRRRSTLLLFFYVLPLPSSASYIRHMLAHPLFYPSVCRITLTLSSFAQRRTICRPHSIPPLPYYSRLLPSFLSPLRFIPFPFVRQHLN